MTEYKLTVTTLSDTMPGSGESVPGVIDRDSRFDEYGLPSMNAKTLKGHLREQMELVKSWTGSSVKTDVLLGATDKESEKSTGKLKFGMLQFSPGVQETIRRAIRDGRIDREEVIRTLSIQYSCTKIDENGVAEDHTLRRDRMLRKGIVLESRIHAVEPLTEEEFRLLEMAVQSLKHIGTHKSKGKGLVDCRIEEIPAVGFADDPAKIPQEPGQRVTDVQPADSQQAAPQVPNQKVGNTPSNGADGVDDPAGIERPDANERGQSAVEPDNASAQGGAVYLTFCVRLEEPVKMGTQGSQSNTRALTYLTGSSLRGAVISLFLKKKRRKNPNYNIEHDKKMLFRNTRFYDAYLQVPYVPEGGMSGDDGDKSETRSMIPLIPVPAVYFADKHEMRSWKKKSGEPGQSGLPLKVHNRMATKPEEGEIRVDVDKYCRLTERVVQTRGVRQTANLHIAISENTSENNLMFRYEAIDKEQDFFAVIRCEDRRAAETFAEALDGEVVYLGGSRGSGYGRCRLDSCEMLDYETLMERYHTSWVQRDGLAGATGTGTSSMLNGSGSARSDDSPEPLSPEDDGLHGSQPDVPLADQQGDSASIPSGVRNSSASLEDVPDSGVNGTQGRGVLTITALSNLLLMSEDGQVMSRIEPAFLERKTGLSGVQLEKAFVTTTMTDGFNHTWKAGQVQQTAVKAGSFFRYTCDLPSDEGATRRAVERLKALEENGVGQRKTEGFGRILINLPLGQEERVNIVAQETAVEEIVLTGDERPILLNLQERIFQDRMTRILRQQAQIYAKKTAEKANMLTLTQMDRLYEQLDRIVTGLERRTCGEAMVQLRNFRDGLTEATRGNYGKARMVLSAGVTKKMSEMLDELAGNSPAGSGGVQQGIRAWNEELEGAKGNLPVLLEESFAAENPVPDAVVGTGGSAAETPGMNIAAGTRGSATDEDFYLKCRYLHELIYILMRKEGGR